jgi:hypothetical protein
MADPSKLTGYFRPIHGAASGWLGDRKNKTGVYETSIYLSKNPGKVVSGFPR